MWPIPDGTILAEGLRSRHPFGTLRAVLFRWWFRPAPSPTDQGTPALQRELSALTDRVQALERAETLREAQHMETLQQLQRLYKRLSMRLTRAGFLVADTPAEAEAESPLALRNRLGKGR